MKKSGSFPFINIFVVFVCVVLIINFFRATTQIGTINFYSILQTFGQANSSLIPFTSSLIDLSITADWGLLNGLRDFINVFTSLISIAIFLSQNVLASINFVVNFVSSFFVV